MSLFETKTCPQCGQELFSDMSVCYGCLYSFGERPTAAGRPLPKLPAIDDLDEVEGMERIASEFPVDGGNVSNMKLRVSTGDAQTTMAIPKNGMVIGRDVLCDVVLKSRAVSKRHTRIVPLDSAIIIEDMGATNPAIFKGREVRETAVVRAGECFDICGTLFTVIL